MSAPEVGCPSWCAEHYAGEIVGTIRTFPVHRTGTRYFGPVSVAVMQVAVGDEKPVLSFDSIDVELRDAGRLAGTMERLGHEDIAAAIRELAELAGGAP